MSINRSDSDDEHALELARSYPSPVAELWRAWTSPQALERWWGPVGCTCPQARFEAREGSAYRFEMRPGGDQELAVLGEVLQLEPEQHLALSWAWSMAPDQVSRVLLELEDQGDRSRLYLRHEGLQDEQDVENHAQGWMSTLDSLDACLRAARAPFAIRHSIDLQALPATVFRALTHPAGLAAWWTADVEAGPEADATDPDEQAEVGELLLFGFGGRQTVFWMRVDALVQDRLVAWSCEGQPEEWTGTSLSWRLEAMGEGTRLHLCHDGWRSIEGGMGPVSQRWAELLLRLRAHVEEGAVDPWFDGLADES